ncbi:MAG: S9 family peptidase, partial [Ktedonobacterales bacterium]
LIPDDFWSLRFITDMRLSPDGRHIAYALESNDGTANERHSAIWLLDTETGASTQFTSGAKRDNSPRWSPDGSHLAFVSNRDNREGQVYVMPAHGGEARQLTHMKHGASDLFWSGDGTWIGFESEVRPDEPPFTPDAHDTAAREHEAQREKDEADRPRIITRLQYRWDGKGYFEGRTHLFRVTIDDGRVEQLTDGDFDNSDGECSPDGRFVAFISDRTDERDANMTSDLWLLDLQTRDLRRLTSATHSISHLAWSPDGARIAFLASPKITDHAFYNTALLVADPATGEITTNLLDALDRSADYGIYGDIPGPSQSAPVWSPDGSALYVLSQRRGGVDVLRAPIAGDAAATETVVNGEDAHLTQIAISPDAARLYALRADPTSPWEIHQYALDNIASDTSVLQAFDAESAPTIPARRLTTVNATVAEQRTIVAPEQFTFPSFDGQQIDGWLYRPARAEGNAPLVLWVHGGPHAAFGQTFYMQAQMLTGLGYAVLHTNPRGSSGYGEAFAQACDHDWGGGDYRDVLAAVDAAIACGGIDSERLAVMGTSYGGYMTNWIVGQTARFKAAVTINSVTNLFTSFGTGDIDSVWASGDYGWPWEREAFYRERSPITYAARVTTPIRIIAAEEDYRCPIAQSEEYYTWLKKLGNVPVDFVRLPKASHGVFASPRQRVRRMELVFEWITRYCPAEEI